MSNITNKHNLPQTLVNLAKRDNYSRGNARISVTQLIGSPRIRILTAEKQAEIVTDVSESLWSLLGRALHSVVEQGADETNIPEERLFTEVAGWRLSGGVDLQLLGNNSDGARQVGLSDYKMTTGSRLPNYIKVLSQKRMIRDIFRTVAHEWVHEHQHSVEKRKIGPDIGGRNEDEANAYAGQLIKIFEKENPEYVETMYE